MADEPVMPAAMRIARELDRVQSESSAINHPNHYGGDTVYETIKVIEAWGLGFNLGNAVKYISRAGRKDPAKEIEDLEKAAFYLKRHIENRKAGKP
jgi:hypothetical protein